MGTRKGHEQGVVTSYVKGPTDWQPSSGISRLAVWPKETLPSYLRAFKDPERISMGENWNRVSKDKPCPVCEKPDWCCTSEDGQVTYCMRIESDCPRGDGWIHRTGEQPQEGRERPERPRKVTDAEKDSHWAPIARALWRNAGPPMDGLARTLGVSRAALDELRVGYGKCDGAWCWSFPERNHDGLIVGINRRLVKPMGKTNKMCAVGSRRGLSYADDWQDRDGPIFLVEGGSDTAAGLTLGLAVVGRPSNVGGVPYLVKLLHPYRRGGYKQGWDRRIVVIGERDKKKVEGHGRCTGCQLCWPGKYGAFRTAGTLRDRLGRRVEWIMPAGAKDLREWLANQDLDVEDYAACCAAGRTLWQ